jgi:hydroxyacylglutathione hydrolase
MDTPKPSALIVPEPPDSCCVGDTQPVLVERSMHPDYLSNAYLVADKEGGTAVYVDSGAPLEPLLAAAERWRVRPVAVLRTHGHYDHVEHEDELAVEVVTRNFEAGGLRVEALPTPGHSDDCVSFVVNGELCFSGDTLFKDSVGGTRSDFEAVRRSVMDVLMALPPETRVLPGHTDETTIGREWEQNPFVRVWRGVDPEGTEPCRVGGEEATIVVWSPDYDGKGKAWVRFADGRDAIVGGSRVERL